MIKPRTRCTSYTAAPQFPMDLIMLARAFVRVKICELVRQGVVKIPAGQYISVIEEWMYKTAPTNEDYIACCKEEDKLQASILRTYAFLNQERTMRRAKRLALFLRNDPHNPKDALVKHVRGCRDDACEYPQCYSSKKMLREHAQCWCRRKVLAHQKTFTLLNASCIVCATAQRCVAQA